MSFENNFLLRVVQRIFSNWTALKIVAENGMGTNYQAQDFCEYITEFICINDQLHKSDVAAELEGYFDDRFNTQLEDGSSEQVAEEILRFYGYYLKKEEALAFSEFERLSPLQSWLMSPDPPKRSYVVAKEDSSSSDDTGDEMEIVNDGWVEVKTRRRK